ncbi:MAG: outer membrane protein assembly factor BamD [Terriglobia bacterium]
MKTTRSKNLLFFGLAALALTVAGCHRHKHAAPDLSTSQEPDKILYTKSVEDIGNKRFNVARITLQTLINTYPDSDYLAKAKLAIADSYYEQGGSGALTHAEIEYKDFITFFPNAPEASYAQYRAAMSQYKQLEKPDRDATHARRAEREFQLLLLNFPASEYAEDGERKLIQVQEVLAESEYRVGRFYFIKGSWRAAASRLLDLVERYPNFSQRDQAFWMLGRCFEKRVSLFWPGNPERAAEAYARIVREHPLSDLVPEALARLHELGKPAPEPDPVLLARARTLQPATPEEEKKGLLGRMFGLFGGSPDTSEAAARLGPPPLEPPADTPSIPPPVWRPGRGQTTVAAESVEDRPAGTTIQSGDAANGNNNDKKNKKKKSFWRKLIPF